MGGIPLREVSRKAGRWTGDRKGWTMLVNLLRGRQVMAKISEFMTVGEASDYIGAHPSSLRRWDRAGKLKARRHPVSRYRLYLKADLDKFLGEFGFAEESVARSSSAKKKRKRTR